MLVLLHSSGSWLHIYFYILCMVFCGRWWWLFIILWFMTCIYSLSSASCGSHAFSACSNKAWVARDSFHPHGENLKGQLRPTQATGAPRATFSVSDRVQRVYTLAASSQLRRADFLVIMMTLIIVWLSHFEREAHSAGGAAETTARQPRSAPAFIKVSIRQDLICERTTGLGVMGGKEQLERKTH